MTALHSSETEVDEFLAQRAAREAQQARRTHELVALLNRRSDLRGVHAMADLAGEQALWCA